jgi:hypothetical protein
MGNRHRSEPSGAPIALLRFLFRAAESDKHFAKPVYCTAACRNGCKSASFTFLEIMEGMTRQREGDGAPRFGETSFE